MGEQFRDVNKIGNLIELSQLMKMRFYHNMTYKIILQIQLNLIDAKKIVNKLKEAVKELICLILLIYHEQIHEIATLPNKVDFTTKMLILRISHYDRG